MEEGDAVRLLVGLDLDGEVSIDGGACRRLWPWFVSVEEKWRGGECERVSEQGSKGGGVVLLIASQGSREERGPGGVDITRGDTATTG